MKTQEILNFFINSEMWRYRKPTFDNNNHSFYSNMKGFTDGRYRIEIQELKRKVEGMKFNIFIYWTPYNPDNLVFKGRLNTVDEMKVIIKNVAPKLLDVSRKHTAATVRGF